MKKAKNIILGIVIAALAALAIWFMAERKIVSDAPSYEPTVLAYLQEISASAYKEAAQSENGAKLRELMISAADGMTVGDSEKNGRNAKLSIEYSYLDTELLKAELQKRMPEKLEAQVNAARLSSEVYDDGQNYLPDVMEKAFSEALSEIEVRGCLHLSTAYIDLKYTKGEWLILDRDAMSGIFTENCDALADELYSSVSAQMPYIPKHYTVPLSDTAAPVPDQDKFGSTTDTAVIEALIASPTAQRLINGQKLAWNKDIEFLRGSEINYYLDETILMLQWKEVTAKAVGTYSEVIIADASQLKRKFAGDAFGDMNFDYASNFAKQTNAVIAYGGDLYNHARACGIVVYGGEIYRFDPDTCDTLYFDRNGDMLYSHRYEFTEQAQAEKLIEENGVDFSVCFGPVLIENGVDVTPESYPWGEINDTYARSAIGQLGKLHYFTVNINCLQPHYYFLATLHDATDAMMAHGCYTAYALDGGQTAETIVNGEMINPVQFGFERAVSDIIYFGTAIPNE